MIEAEFKVYDSGCAIEEWGFVTNSATPLKYVGENLDTDCLLKIPSRSSKNRISNSDLNLVDSQKH